jgi:uncharacterized protein involved in exopolysaccharide biosynthesis
VVKNLEIAKVALSQETPTIQMVDQSTLPLKKEKVSKKISAFIGGIVAGLLFSVFLLLRRWWKRQLLQQKKSVGSSAQLSAQVLIQSETTDIANSL